MIGNGDLRCIWCGTVFGAEMPRTKRIEKMIAHEKECAVSPLVKDNADLRRVNAELSKMLSRRVPVLGDYISPRRTPQSNDKLIELARLVRETATEDDVMVYAPYETCGPDHCALCGARETLPRRLTGMYCVAIALLCQRCQPKWGDELGVTRKLETAAENGGLESVFVWTDGGRMKMIENGLTLSFIR